MDWNESLTNIFISNQQGSFESTTGICTTATLVIGVASILLYIKTCVKFISKDEQLVLKKLTDEIIINGPKVAYINPITTKKCTVNKALSLASMEYCVIKNILSGEQRVEVGQLALAGRHVREWRPVVLVDGLPVMAGRNVTSVLRLRAHGHSSHAAVACNSTTVDGAGIVI